jgi:hypothetical protein
MRGITSIVTIGEVLALTGSALADFSGQTILGPLVNGSSVSGNNTGASDDNDGWYSGMHIFDIWDGGDDVWALNWTGGPMHIEMLYDNFFADPDLFLYVPGHLDESSYDSIINTGVETIALGNAAAGTYYILVDSTAGAEGAYRLNITPAPATLGLLSMGFASFASRSRRSI